jgi:hypothetical protein
LHSSGVPNTIGKLSTKATTFPFCSWESMFALLMHGQANSELLFLSLFSPLDLQLNPSRNLWVHQNELFIEHGKKV